MEEASEARQIWGTWETARVSVWLWCWERHWVRRRRRILGLQFVVGPSHLQGVCSHESLDSAPDA